MSNTEIVKANGAPAPAASVPAPVVGPPLHQPQYVTNFDGIAEAPFPEAARAVLAAPVDPLEVDVKADGIVYLPGVAYRRILTRAFGAGGWALAPRTPSRFKGDLITYHGALFCLGRFASEATGQCMYRAGNGGMTEIDALEGARTDCITRCCKDLGIAAELWDPDWRAWWHKHYAIAEKYTPRSGKHAGEECTRWKKRATPLPAPPPPSGRSVSGAPPAAVPAAPDAGAPAPAQPPAEPPSPEAPADTGEVASHDEQQAVRAAAKDLGWAPARAGAWLKKHFHCNSTGFMTQQQAADVLALLLAWKQGDQAYDAVFAKLLAAGRVYT